MVGPMDKYTFDFDLPIVTSNAVSKTRLHISEDVCISCT